MFDYRHLNFNILSIFIHVQLVSTYVISQMKEDSYFHLYNKGEGKENAAKEEQKKEKKRKLKRRGLVKKKNIMIYDHKIFARWS